MSHNLYIPLLCPCRLYIGFGLLYKKNTIETLIYRWRCCMVSYSRNQSIPLYDNIIVSIIVSIVIGVYYSGYSDYV